MHGIATMCRVLGVSPGGYYARRARPPSRRARADAELCVRIAEIHRRSRATYGAPRIQVELREQGLRVGRKRVARLMRVAKLKGVSRRWVTTTVRDHDAQPAPDLVERNFSASGPDRLWVADISYIPTWAGFLYLAVVLDAFSRKIVGWAMATHLRTELALSALNMALGQRRPAGGDSSLRPWQSVRIQTVVATQRSSSSKILVQGFRRGLPSKGFSRP
jgi:putative transposase